MTKYEWDTRCADLELSRLQGGFTTEDHQNFAAILLMAFEAVQGAVHVETGRLKASGRASVEESGSERWSGEIGFGGGTVKWAASEHFGYSEKHGGYPNHVYFRRAGWQPFERAAVSGEERVPWTLGPISNTPTATGVPIEDDFLGPVTSFFSRGRRTPHPEEGGL